MHPLLRTGIRAFTLLSLLSLAIPVFGQQTNPVYVDKQGVLRWQKGNAEANFFGVNYTVPFAYGYRSHKALGLDVEKAIDQDVYHMARLGFNAFRVHVWDTEISDSLGNLLQNEHLRLFDYLVHQLKQRNIKILITPIAFWGPGYPEPDIDTGSFSSKYGKQKAVTEEAALKAQERYLEQFLKHVNPYTKLTYQDDPDVIAAEVNNEPHHTGPKERATEYINRMVSVMRATGWTKPIFYNISESPAYADAVAKANVDGVSFQWYPTGLVANRTLQGNFLPHVDKYQIPFDTIPQFAGKARMVYEFDAGDIAQPIMYPAMARSFREAGFQWATQFAYDPMATAYANTEYQTHYVNLAYTPSKAISLLIASKAFHKLPRLKQFDAYPADSVFDVFRLSYQEQLSEMNTPAEFYYSNNTRTKPVNASKLRHIAGVGTSQLVQYTGLGAYFLDKLENGVWRLEVMPDAIPVSDPFAKASSRKEVTRIQWRSHAMQIVLSDLGQSFAVDALNEGNRYSTKSKGGSFQIEPGTYLLTKNGSKRKDPKGSLAHLQLSEFVAPQPHSSDPYVTHEPIPEVSAGKPFVLKALVTDITPQGKVTLLMNNLSGIWKTIEMKPLDVYTYQTEVPADILTPGLVNYRIMVQKGQDDYITFPGNHKGNPHAWDYYQDNKWQLYVAAENSALEIFNAGKDRNLMVYPNLWRSDERQLITAEKPGQLILKLSNKDLNMNEHVLGWQHYFADKLEGRRSELAEFQKLVLRARTDSKEPIQVKVTLISTEATAYGASITLHNTMQEMAIPLSALKPDKFMLLPRPYPGFHPFWFQAAGIGSFRLSQIEKIEVSLGQGIAPEHYDKPYSFEIESIWLSK
ncbi:cellulase family glycosylhydrolase [Pontibacter sp. JH31]|uniref:Cellulase family glycosylhydrolase n=1 Tax=Pontibacter aquaedesilientis TaxID=2766980 RepID=A0ABR7XEJ1_9BACT|nr:cellulase family glycosylhydrolase [Pontibacter aquaedesilientis]MBD1396028.1 cellulase family glycosylhydrolase [Pontibacter aquaedesilientis]